MAFLSLRLSFYYICVFSVIGVVLPFWPVWLKSNGLSGVEIGIIAAIPILAKMLFSPFFASMADQKGHKKRLLNLLIATALFFFCQFIWADSFASLLIISLLYGICWAPIMSFGDSIALLSIRKTPIQYGRLRLWGSVSFIILSFSMGLLLEIWSEDLIFWVMALAIALTLCSSFLLPDPRMTPLGKDGKPVQKLFQMSEFRLFLISVALIHGSHALYYGFATIHWRSLGHDDIVIGLLWGWAVVVEVLFFLFAGRIGQLLPAVTFLILAAGAAILRWVCMVYDPNIFMLFLIQSLHGLSFGAMHAGAMKYINDRVSLDLSTSAQSLYGASAFGLGTGITMLWTGVIYDHMNSQGYFVMTLMALCGTFVTFVLRHRINKTAIS